MTQYLPQISLFCLNILMVGIVSARHGQPNNKPVDASVPVVRMAILHLILWWGGWYTSQI